MSLETDLLKLARSLATRDRGRPKQASLRRAVSTAYYALFHLLIREATQRLLRGPALDDHRPSLARAFKHRSMKRASLAIQSGGTLKYFGSVAAPSELRVVADAFVTLQEARHHADYDLSTPFTRTETLTLVNQAEFAFECWKEARKQPAADIYLAALLVYPADH
ncbi:MAG: hypothetical protein H6752_00895 [Candidatus Omnitrophica bacterium]|nr:hypothetical protein [Candidatus Omnitrophota bacterium]